jgi:hypothetical protein
LKYFFTNIEEEKKYHFIFKLSGQNYLRKWGRKYSHPGKYKKTKARDETEK